MKIEVEIRNTENIGNLTNEDMLQIREIVRRLVEVGGLTRVRGGQTNILFDQFGVFQKIELKYYPYVKRKRG